MKNKRLLFNLLAVLTGIAFLTLSATGTFNNQAAIQAAPELDGFEASVEYLASIRNNQLTGTIDPADVLKAQQMSLKAGASGMDIDWVSGGPDNFAGRTRAIIYDNRDPEFNTLYAASTSGGLWKSSTGGILWDFIPGTEEIMNVTCMIQDSDGKIYVGTGEAFSVDRFAANPGFMGSGIYVSANDDVFQVLQSTQPEVNDPTSAWAYVGRIAILPSNPQMIYAATYGGLKYSENGGDTWTHATDTAGVALTLPATDVKIGDDGITVASVNNFVYISDSGNPDEFINYSTGGTDRLPFASISRVELAIAPSDPNYIYAVVASGIPAVGQLENVYLTINRGATWRVVGPGGSNFFNVFGTTNVGMYANSVIVHPENKDIVLVGGQSLWQGTKIQEEGYYEWKNKVGQGAAPWFSISNHHVYVFKPNDFNTIIIGTDRGIFRSSDGLETFENINRNYVTSQCYSVAFNSGRRILSGTQSNGVLFISEEGNTDRQARRIDQSLLLNGGNVALSVINQDALIWTTAVPSTSTPQPVPIFRSNDLGETVSLHEFEPVSITVRNFLPTMLFWESLNFEHSRDSVTFFASEALESGTEVWVRSHNSRYPFKYTLPVDLVEGDSIRVQDPIATRLFYGLQTTSMLNSVYMTFGAIQFTGPATWHEILVPQGIPQSFGISQDGNYLWVGTKSGDLYRLGNLHGAYDASTATVDSADYAIEVLLIEDFATRAITSIAVDPQNPDHVIITLGNYGNDHYIFRSSNATASNPDFISVQGNLPKMPVYSSLIELDNPNIVFLGTEKGIWVTEDIDNPGWAKESGDMGNVAVFHLKQQIMNTASISVPIDDENFETFPGVDNYGKIYAATFGRGIYKTNRFIGVAELPESNNARQARLHIYPNPASETLFIAYNNNKSSQVEVSITDLSGRTVKHQGFGMLNAGQQTLQMDISSLKSGIYLIQLKNDDRTLGNKLIVR